MDVGYYVEGIALLRIVERLQCGSIPPAPTSCPATLNPRLYIVGFKLFFFILIFSSDQQGTPGPDSPHATNNPKVRFQYSPPLISAPKPDCKYPQQRRM